MFTEDKMTINEHYKYLRCMKRRYRKANRKERSRLLSEMEAVAGLHRKSPNQPVASCDKRSTS